MEQKLFWSVVKNDEYDCADWEYTKVGLAEAIAYAKNEAEWYNEKGRDITIRLECVNENAEYVEHKDSYYIRCEGGVLVEEEFKPYVEHFQF